MRAVMEKAASVSEINQHAAVSQRGLAPIMSTAAHNDLQLIGSGKENGRNNILLIIDANQDLRNAIRNQAVPQIPME